MRERERRLMECSLRWNHWYLCIYTLKMCTYTNLIFKIKAIMNIYTETTWKTNVHALNVHIRIKLCRHTYKHWKLKTIGLCDSCLLANLKLWADFNTISEWAVGFDYSILLKLYSRFQRNFDLLKSKPRGLYSL